MLSAMEDETPAAVSEVEATPQLEQPQSESAAAALPPSPTLATLLSEAESSPPLIASPLAASPSLALSAFVLPPSPRASVRLRQGNLKAAALALAARTQLAPPLASSVASASSSASPPPLVPALTASATRSHSPNRAASVSAADTPRATDRFFMTPMEGLVSNKPFSLEVFLRLTHRSSRSSIELMAPLAIKVSARHMEKRSNTYKPIERVWATASPSLQQANDKPEVKVVRPPSEKVEGTPAAAVGVKSAAASEGGPEARRRSTATTVHPFGISSVFSRSSRTCPSAQLKAASRHTKAQYDASKDRTIGMSAVRLKAPSDSTSSIRGGSPSVMLAALSANLAVEYEPAALDGRRGLLEYVVTKGGGAPSRPSQRYVLMQSGFGYRARLPIVPPEFQLEAFSLHLRSWEWEVSPLKLQQSVTSLPTYPIPPKRRRSGATEGEVERSGPPPSNGSGKPRPRRKSSIGASRKRKRPVKIQESNSDEASEAGSSTESEGEDEPEVQIDPPPKPVPRTSKRLLLPTRHGRSLTALLSAAASAVASAAPSHMDSVMPFKRSARAVADKPQSAQPSGSHVSLEPAASAGSLWTRPAGGSLPQLVTFLAPVLAPVTVASVSRKKKPAAAASSTKQPRKKAKIQPNPEPIFRASPVSFFPPPQPRVDLAPMEAHLDAAGMPTFSSAFPSYSASNGLPPMSFPQMLGFGGLQSQVAVQQHTLQLPQLAQPSHPSQQPQVSQPTQPRVHSPHTYSSGPLMGLPIFGNFQLNMASAANWNGPASAVAGSVPAFSLTERSDSEGGTTGGGSQPRVSMLPALNLSGGGGDWGRVSPNIHHNQVASVSPPRHLHSAAAVCSSRSTLSPSRALRCDEYLPEEPGSSSSLLTPPGHYSPMQLSGMLEDRGSQEGRAATESPPATLPPARSAVSRARHQAATSPALMTDSTLVDSMLVDTSPPPLPSPILQPPHQSLAIMIPLAEGMQP